MYGYVRPYDPELKVREKEYYRAVYCGLCRTMGRCTGLSSRLSLSYDLTYFALLRMAICGESPRMRRRRCAVHPTHRRPMAEPDEALMLAARVSALLLYHKVRDDRDDEQGLHRAAATFLVAPAAGLRRRALAATGTPKADRHTVAEAMLATDAALVRAMDGLAALEASRPRSVDEPADRFGEIISMLLSQGLSDDRARLAAAIGHHLGRWVYILDAADDLEEDAKAGRYNPLLCLWSGQVAPMEDIGATESYAADIISDTVGDTTDAGKDTVASADTFFSPARREEVRIALAAELLGLERAMDLLEYPDPDLCGVLRNILYEGMPRVMERVLGSPCANRTED